MKMRDHVRYEGEWKNCDNYHESSEHSGAWCNCPFLGCTGETRCVVTYRKCDLKRDVNQIDYNDMQRGRDCQCDWLDRDAKKSHE